MGKATEWFRRTFHRMGSPRWFFAGSRGWMLGLYLVGGALIAIGSTWGLGFAPTDRLQGDSYRILYVHVPAAHLAEAVYVAIAIAGAVHLVWRMKMADLAIAAAAPVGMTLTAAALATGYIWGIPTWGTGWVWDARTTSMLVLLFLYFGLIALRQAVPRADRAALAVSVLAIVGVVNIPIIKYSVDWFTTLHQPASIRIGERPSIDPSMLWPLAVNALGYYLFLVGVVIAALRAKIIEREAKADWVRTWVQAR
ncbi:MAG: heme ABC transporter permease CcmC [Gammaproteobacteria bacterium]|nr:heme ABC transporter permease CcmC [Gammaproteobacteria bacterium]